jgi:hypothetical protein
LRPVRFAGVEGSAFLFSLPAACPDRQILNFSLYTNDRSL